MDEFDALYEDELDALQDLEDIPNDGHFVKGKKCLDFSTPSSIRSKSLKDINGSILGTPLDDSADSTEENTLTNIAISKRKRSEDESYKDVSDDESDKEKENITFDLPELKAPTRKRAKLLEDQPIPEDFDQEFQPSLNAIAKGYATNTSSGASQVVAEPPKSQSLDSDITDIKKKGKIVDEKFTAEERRLTQNYDFERKRVQRRIPFERDFISVSNGIGQKFYMELRDEEVADAQVSAEESSHNSLSFLGVPLNVLKAQIEEDKRARAQQDENAHRASYPETLDDIPAMCEVSEIQKRHENLYNTNLWVDKYSPQRYTELLSDESTNRILLKWLKLWDYVVFGREKKPAQEKKKSDAAGGKKDQQGHKFFNKFAPEVIEELDNHQRPMQKIALLCGPPGLGKTTLGHVIAKHAGYNAVEMNASDDRSTEIFKQKVESAIQMKSVIEADPRPNCLIIDEIDGSPAATINILLNIIKSSDAQSEGKKKKRKPSLLLRPIICICNDLYAPALRPLRQHALVVNFPITEPTKLAGRLMEISKLENTKSDLTTLLALCEKAENDIRSCINTLQFVKGRGRELTPHVVQSMSLGQKDINKSLLSVWKHVFTMPRQKRKRYVNPYDRSTGSANVMDIEQALLQNNTTPASRFKATLNVVEAAGEHEKVLAGLFENYMLPKVKDPHMDTYILGNEWMEFNDLIGRQINTSQNYTLMRYTSYIAVEFHLLFASLTPFKVQYPQTTEVRNKQQKYDNLIASLVSDVTPSVRKNLSKAVTVMDFLPHMIGILQPTLRPVNTQLFSAREKSDLLNLISIMIAYNITYRQERGEDGTYSYVLDPNIEELVTFPEMRPKKQLTYAMKQLISREVELERMRRSEWKDEDIVEQTPAPKKEEVKDVKPKPDPGSKEQAGQIPNHLRQTLQPKAIKEETTYARDFFGRRIEKKPKQLRKEAEKKKEEQIGGEIWFSFKEGFSNAVRRTVRVKEFM